MGVQETRKEYYSGQFLEHRMKGDNIKMDVREVRCEDVGCM